jgi:hypothetical protein
MDAFDFIDEKPKEKRDINFTDIVWNIATIYFLLCAVVAGAVFLLLFFNPEHSLNPFPPSNVFVVPTQMVMPTSRPTQDVQPTATFTLTPTMVMPTATVVLIGPTETQPPPTPTELLVTPSTPTEEVTGEMPFALQEGNPTPLDASIFRPDLGCNFMGVAGQALDTNGAPILNLEVELSGVLDGNPTQLIGLTGVATQYGPGGYELKLAGKPIASISSLMVQLKDQDGLPLSNHILFDTYEDCSKNLILITFIQVR